MKRTLLILSAATLLFTACNNEVKSDTAANDDSSKSKTADASMTSNDPAPVKMSREEMDKAWMENMTPGEMHKVIASTNGTWDCDITHWMGIDSTPMKSKGTTVSKSAFNGLFQESEHTGDMMGMKFTGKETMGYDNSKKKFVSTWYDNMGSMIIYSTGDYDAAAKTITMTGDCINPATGKPMNLKWVYKLTDNDNMVMEMWGPDMATGKEYKSMEIVMKRKK